MSRCRTERLIRTTVKTYHTKIRLSISSHLILWQTVQTLSFTLF